MERQGMTMKGSRMAVRDNAGTKKRRNTSKKSWSKGTVSRKGVKKGEVRMKNIVETAMDAGNFKMLLSAAKIAGIDKELAMDRNLTVFAPTDEAFHKIPQHMLDNLMKDKKALAKVLMYHVVRGKVMKDKAEAVGRARTMEGEEVHFRNKGIVNRCFAVDNACITMADIPASNGVIHAIDMVLMPESMEEGQMMAE